MSQDRRIVITGLGAVTPVGNDVDTTFKNLLEGKNGVGQITSFDASNYGARIAAHVKDFDVLKHGVDKKDARRMDTFVQFAIASADMAIKDSGLDLEKEDREKVGVLVGSGIGGLPDDVLHAGEVGGQDLLGPMPLQRDDAGAVDDGIAAVECLSTRCGVGHVADDVLGQFEAVRPQDLRGLLRIADEEPQLVARGRQCRSRVGSDESARIVARQAGSLVLESN